MPEMVSLLRRELDDTKSFDDFYQAWLPNTAEYPATEVDGLDFHYFFPGPTRVINAINPMNPMNPKEIFSIGFSWVTNEEQRQALWQYVQKLSHGDDKQNEELIDAK